MSREESIDTFGCPGLCRALLSGNNECDQYARRVAKEGPHWTYNQVHRATGRIKTGRGETLMDAILDAEEISKQETS